MQPKAFFSRDNNQLKAVRPFLRAGILVMNIHPTAYCIDGLQLMGSFDVLLYDAVVQMGSLSDSSDSFALDDGYVLEIDGTRRLGANQHASKNHYSVAYAHDDRKR